MEIRKLNTLRGIAALIVVISHYSNTTNILNGALGNGAGQFGVMLFFLLSGFLMSYLYMSRSFSKVDLYKYATARFARVVPLFLIVVICSYILQLLGFTGILYNIPNEESFISHILLLSGVSVLWTIPAEIQFYFIFLFLWWLWKKSQTQLLVLIACLVIFLFYIDFERVSWRLSGLKIDSAIIPSLPYFLMGVIIGQLYLRWKAPGTLCNNKFVVSLLIIPLLYPQIYTAITGHEHEMWADASVFFTVSMVFFSIIFLVPDDNIVMSNNIGDFLGKISYSLYLLHLPVLWQIKTLAISYPVMTLPLFIALVIVASYASFVIIEDPSRRIIRHIAFR